MKYRIQDLPKVHPMMVRRFVPDPSHGWGHQRDKVVYGNIGAIQNATLDVDEIGLADARLSFDEDVVDQSGFVFELTSRFMMGTKQDCQLLVFTSRRWRNHRWEHKNEQGHDMEWPTKKEPLLFIGNPYLIEVKNGAIIVHRESSYLIKSGMQLQHEHGL